MNILGKVVDVVNKRIYGAEVVIENDVIVDIVEKADVPDVYLLPGLIDAHVHIESSMLVPVKFAELAVKHGTVAVVSDPHEIANVMGIKGVNFMTENAKKSPMKFYFGAPSCVPATGFETSGATLNSGDIEELLKRDDIYFLSEMMNYPGVIFGDKEVAKKIKTALNMGKPIDGHAPGVVGEELEKYAGAGITTDHECTTVAEAEAKIKQGMKIQIREGSSAKNFDTLFELIDKYPDKVMLCTDDSHPDDLAEAHIDKLIRRGQKKGLDFFNLISAATVNPVRHYNLDVGLLQKNDKADFIVVDNLETFSVLKTYIDGKEIQKNEIPQSDIIKEINNFNARYITKDDIVVSAKGDKIKVIEAFDGELLTKKKTVQAKIENNYIVSDIENDVLKIVVHNRYSKDTLPAVGFIRNFGFKRGAVAESIAHDSHNIIAVGTNDDDIVAAINKIVKNKGGISVCENGECEILKLNIAGLMSDTDGKELAEKYIKLNNKAKSFGKGFKNPFMTLSFMALLVIPEIKLGDKGLFDGNKFNLTSLFSE